MICIIQSTLHKCVFAPVTPRGPKVLSHSALGAPHAEPLRRQLAMAIVACRRERSIPVLLTGLSLTEMSVGEYSWMPSALLCFLFYLSIRSDFHHLI